tara:strand:+ start:620 stop:988 length:369 start_codon:yes stop_codon:yes gene_type:complete
MIIKTRQDLNEFLETSEFTVFKFSATWCKPCKKIQPFVHSCLEKYCCGFVNMIYVDVDESQDVCNFLKIRKMPTFMFFLGKDRMWVLESSNEKEIDTFFSKVRGVVEEMVPQKGEDDGYQDF